MPQSKACDGQEDCYNGEDEELCSDRDERTFRRPDPPAIVRLNRQGRFTVHRITVLQSFDYDPAPCPRTHFQCPGQSVPRSVSAFVLPRCRCWVKWAFIIASLFSLFRKGFHFFLSLFFKRSFTGFLFSLFYIF